MNFIQNGAAPVRRGRDGSNAMNDSTEDRSATSRDLVWGDVHDDNAWSLGDVAGHAGLFGTTDELESSPRRSSTVAPPPTSPWCGPRR